MKIEDNYQMQIDSNNLARDADQDPSCQTTSTNIHTNEFNGVLDTAVGENQNLHATESYLDPGPSSMTSRPPPRVQSGSFDTVSMGNALPAADQRQQAPFQYVQDLAQPYGPAISPPMAAQMPPIIHYGGPPMQMAAHPYYFQQPQMPPYYVAGHLPQGQNQLTRPGRQNMIYYPNHIIMNHAHQAFYYPHSGQFPNNLPAVPTNMMSGDFVARGRRPEPRAHRNMIGRTSSEHASKVLPLKSSIVRGPPRKPRQSGHALWIGNLPPQTDLMALVRHVCKETSGLESLFLISKSNCAFANFKDEPTCSEAQQKLQDSKFQSVRLVSRLRNGTIGATTGISGTVSQGANSISSKTQEDDKDSTVDLEGTNGAAENEKTSVSEADVNEHVQESADKFFILKSLTIQDLDSSVQTGIWATQTHNEESLNDAFRMADNVYLIFSANKSGEYFGYARMTSEINQDPAAAVKFPPKIVSTAEVDKPKAVSTEADEYVPKGKIIDDSARGTIFWEADRDDSEAGSDIESETTSDRSPVAEDEEKVWGKPFKLEWLSTNRLPFFCTRGLRNPWNSNREVKIARDGTELEPLTGRKLIGLFNRTRSSNVGSAPAPAPMSFMQGYTPMQTY